MRWRREVGAGWLPGEQGKCLGYVGVMAGGQVWGGHREVVAGRYADLVDDLVVRAELVLWRQDQLAAVVQDVPGSGACDDARGPGADEDAEVQVFDRAAECVAGRGAVAVGEHDQGQVQ